MSEVRAVNKTDMPEINAAAAIVVTQHEGQILLEKNAKHKMYPAFLTKILASIIALEKCNISDIITVSEKTVNEIAQWKGSAVIGLTAGEQITVRDIIYSMMLVSANDSMFALAEFLCGDIDKLAVMMQDKARDIGAVDTTVVSSDNKFTSEQLSTAYDMAIICRYCMTNRLFRKICAADKYVIPATNKSPARNLQNTNLLINSQNRRYRYETAIGIKSGYTVRSKACLACSALPPKGKNGEEILTVVLGAENTKQMKYAFYDAITLLNFTFDYYESLSGKKADDTASHSENAITTVNELADILGAKLRNAADMPISSFAFGKQKVKPGYAYFATNEDEAGDAHSKGAAVIISEKQIPRIPNIVVNNLENAMSSTAVFIKSKLGLWSIAVLDSPDKINPIRMCAEMLSDKSESVASFSPTNNYNSMLRAMFSVTNKTKSAIINVSCVERDNAEKISRTANFDVAIFTSTVVSQNPLDLTKPELTEEKLKVCSGMNESGAVIINIDDKNLAGIFTIEQDVITIGVDNKMADYYADNIDIARDKIKFDIFHGGQNYRIELYSDDKHSVYQALATFALGEVMGIPPKRIVTAIENYRPTNGITTVRNEKGTYIVTDFKNDTPESISAALKELCTLTLPPQSRRIAVLSDIAEGDKAEEEIFRKVGEIVTKANIDITVCYGKAASSITKTADMKAKFVVRFETREALTEFLKLNIRDGDAVLFKGSEDSELEEIMAQTT